MSEERFGKKLVNKKGASQAVKLAEAEGSKKVIFRIPDYKRQR